MSLNLHPHPDAVAQRVGDEIVLVHLKTDRIYSLNATGARIWELLQHHDDIQTIKRCLLSEFNVEETRLEDELHQLIAALTDEHFLHSSKS